VLMKGDCHWAILNESKLRNSQRCTRDWLVEQNLRPSEHEGKAQRLIVGADSKYMACLPRRPFRRDRLVRDYCCVGFVAKSWIVFSNRADLQPLFDTVTGYEKVLLSWNTSALHPATPIRRRATMPSHLRYLIPKQFAN